jgi:hypothetical protein
MLHCPVVAWPDPPTKKRIKVRKSENFPFNSSRVKVKGKTHENWFEARVFLASRPWKMCCQTMEKLNLFAARFLDGKSIFRSTPFPICYLIDPQIPET